MLLVNKYKTLVKKMTKCKKKHERCFTSLKIYLGEKMHKCLRTFDFASPNFLDKLICVSLSMYVWKISLNCVCIYLSALSSPNLSFHGVFFNADVHCEPCKTLKH